MDQDETPTSFSKQVGRRLRAVRKGLGLSLEDVEARSKGRWSASAIGAYERGYRNLSLPRLGELAEFFGVPVSTLLSDDAPVPTSIAGEVIDLTDPVEVDLHALERAPVGDELDPTLLRRYCRTIASERRGGVRGVMSLRRTDVSLVATMYGMSVIQLREMLQRWGALVDEEQEAVAG